MRCCGRTKSLNRCKINKVKWYYPFCRVHHWWQPLIMLLITIPAIVATYGGIYQDIIKLVNSNFSKIEPSITINADFFKDAMLIVVKDSIDSYQKTNNESLNLLKIPLEIKILNDTDKPFSLTGIRTILISTKDIADKVYLEINSPFRVSRHPNVNLVDLPIFIEPKEEIFLYLKGYFPICEELKASIDNRIEEIGTNSVPFYEINNTIFKHNEEVFSLCFIYNNNQKHFEDFFISLPILVNRTKQNVTWFKDSLSKENIKYLDYFNKFEVADSITIARHECDKTCEANFEQLNIN